jgi:hypothetical protein
MAPSLETSSVGRLPLPQTSPVRAISAAIRQYRIENMQRTAPLPETLPSSTLGPAMALDPSVLDSGSASEDLNDLFCAILNNSPGVGATPPLAGQYSPLSTGWHLAAEEAAEALASTSVSFLVLETPLTSTNRLPAFIPSPLTPTRKRKHQLLDTDPENETELTYQDALRQSYACEDQSKAELTRMQSTVVLQSMFCERLSSQLAAQEEKQKSAHKKKGKLVGDGLPRLLTGDEFHNRVVEHEKATVEEDMVREERRKLRDERTEVLGPWKEAEAARLERNRVRRQAYKDELVTWEAERDLAKAERRRTRWTQPKLGKLESPLPKPAFESVHGEDGNGDDECSVDSDDGGDD